MTNKRQIQKLRNNAELAMASYGYFDLVGKKFDIKDERIKNSPRIDNLTITQTDILDSTYKDYEVKDTGWIFDDKLKGDFTPTQAQRFFSRYDLLIHQPNTESGFSATLFGEKRKQKNTESKEIKYTSEYGYINYVLAIRGAEPNNKGDIGADTKLALGNIPKKQHLDMLLFYYQCIGKILFMQKEILKNI